MDYAGSPFEIKSLSDCGAIEGLLAGFDNVDSHGDRIAPVAFKRTLSERGTRPLPMLLHHDLKRPIGAWKEWAEKPDGLYVKGSLTLSTRDAQEAYSLAKEGALTGVNLNGLITNATAFSDPLSVSSPTMIDTVGTGILQVSLADFMPNGIVMHPSDWMRIRLLKNTDGEYLLGDPQSNPSPLLFGLPVVATTAMSVDKFLIGDFRAAATLYDREGANVALSTEDGDNFVRNMLTIRCEERLGLAIKQATALSYGDFGNVA